MTDYARVITPLWADDLVAAEAVAVAWHESRGDPQATNSVGNTPAGSVDRGMWQFNSHWHPEVTDTCAFDPACSTAAAHALWLKSGWSPWSAYSSGAYRPFLANAKGAVLTARLPFTPATAGVFTTGDVILDTLGQITGAFTRLTGLDAIGHFFAFLTDPDLWKRLAVGAAGVTIIGIVLFAVISDKTPAAAAAAVVA